MAFLLLKLKLILFQISMWSCLACTCQYQCKIECFKSPQWTGRLPSTYGIAAHMWNFLCQEFYASAEALLLHFLAHPWQLEVNRHIFGAIQLIASWILWLISRLERIQYNYFSAQFQCLSKPRHHWFSQLCPFATLRHPKTLLWSLSASSWSLWLSGSVFGVPRY